ncbi:MAG: DNA-formamidopyrimidine glycosylase [Thermoleophilia bacterium]|jgi:formamidopyrimidine-DNA glycosylase
MPELPEVETIRRQLANSVIGHTFTNVAVQDPLVTAPAAVKSFKRQLLGRNVIELSRRGKYLRFELDNGFMLVIHLRMTGRLTAVNLPIDKDLKKHLRLLFCFEDETCIAFNDARRFGKAFILKASEAMEYWKKMGPEPLDRSFNAARLKRILEKRNRPIKSFLLDQHMVAGIGNIYADEALYLARIHPLCPASELSDDEIDLLVRSIKSTLRSAIAHKGSSIDTYRDSEGRKGEFQDTFNVHRREGEPCPACGRTVEKIKVGGRGTYFCPACQIYEK